MSEGVKRKEKKYKITTGAFGNEGIKKPRNLYPRCPEIADLNPPDARGRALRLGEMSSSLTCPSQRHQPIICTCEVMYAKEGR